MGAKITEEKANQWLATSGFGLRYKILEWGTPCKILDCERGVEFSYKFSNFKSVLKRYPDRIFAATEEEKKKKREETNLKRRGVKYPAQDSIVIKKRDKTNIEKYGTKCSLQGESPRSKTEETMIERYGAKNPSQVKTLVKKRENTMMERYGVASPMQSEEIRKRAEETWMKKYGKKNPNLSREVREKIEKTNTEKYGFKSNLSSPENKEKEIKTKKEQGQIITHQGKLLSEWSKEIGCSYTFLLNLSKEDQSIDFSALDSSKTKIEKKIESWLEDRNVNFISDKKIMEDSLVRPDFYIPDFNLIIECDGLFWHSDFFHGKDYHIKKKRLYDKSGFVSLFFRSDEIKRKFPIVESIILNKMHLSKRLYARKLKHGTCSRDFFEQSHLMGKGQGRIYSLNLDDEPMAAMQVKWKNKKERVLEVSRFCTKLNHSVVGGWSKILKRVVQEEKPNKIITFIDRRYGSGEYLEKMGWKKKSEYPSFMWTNGKVSLHRMIYPGNSGYEKNLRKIWDCGQAKWEKIFS